MKPIAIVLAGGKSTRMGCDKAFVAIAGEPLLQRVCRVAGAVAQPVWIVAPAPEKYTSLLSENCALLPETPIANPSPLTGFACALQRISQAADRTGDEWVLLLACDLPYLRSQSLQAGIDRLARVPAGAIAFLAKHPKGWEPLCGFYRLSHLPALEAYIERGGRSFQGFLADRNVAEWDGCDRRIFFNCNTPADVASTQNH